MKKTKNFFFFKLISNLRIAIIFFIVFGFNFNFSFGYDPYKIPTKNSGDDRQSSIPTTPSAGSLKDKLRDKLEEEEFIYRYVTKKDSMYTAGVIEAPTETWKARSPADNLVNKIFKQECFQEYNEFDTRRQSFLEELNSNTNSKSEVSDLHNPIESIGQDMHSTFSTCVKTIYDKYNHLYKSFTQKINANYSKKLAKKGTPAPAMFKPHLFTQFIDRLKSTKNNTNFNEIKDYIDEFDIFQMSCLYRDRNPSSTGNTILEMQEIFQTGRDGNTHNNKPINPIPPQVKQYFETQDRKKCVALRKKFTQFSNSDIFKKFIALPKKCRASNESNYEKLTELSKDCQNMINNLEPKYTDSSENKKNLFYKCNESINTAYTECFGKEGKRSDLQEILNLLNQKSPALCDGNKLDRAYTAYEKCRTAVIKCTDSCRTQIDSFKQNFLQCFFLPDFKKQSYTQFHQDTQCKYRITELRKSFISQAEAEPFDVKANDPAFDTLDNSNTHNNSIAYKISKACENPLEKNQIEIKLKEMRTICREHKQNNPQNLFIDPATANINSQSSGSGSKGSSSNTNTNSQAFSYDTNKGLKLNNSLQEGNTENSDLQIKVPAGFTDPNKNSDNSSKKNKDISSGDFKDGAEALENTLSSIEDDISNSNQRGLSSDGSLEGENELSSEETTSETEESEKESQLNSTVRRLLSSDKEYGVINENVYSQQSGTQGFFNWMKNKADKAKKASLNAYDKMVGIGPAAFREKLHLNNQNVNLFELQGKMFKQACNEHKCPTEVSSQ